MVSTAIASREPSKEEPKPLLFRFPTADGRHPSGREREFQYGCYFPGTDLVVTDMGGRGTGKPQWPGIEWLDSEFSAPVPMIVVCPKCGKQHVDQDEWATTRLHRKHLCHFCGLIWLVAPIHTVGVADLPGT